MIKKIFTIAAVILLLATCVSGTTTRVVSDKLGVFTGPASGTEQDDNVKASLDIIHTILGSPYLDKGTGSVIFVDSGASSGSETGTSWENAELTLDAGINECTEDLGDYILVAPGHAENWTAADAVDVDKAGITVIGLGSGEQRPVFNFTATGGEIRIDDADFYIENCVFKAHVDSVTHAFDITDNAHGLVIKDCDFIVDTEGTDEFDDAIDIVAGADYCTIKNCNFHMGGADAVSAITFDSSDFMVIQDCYITGDYSTACIVGETAASLGALIKDNVLYNGDTGTFGLNAQPCIELYATDNGTVINNACFCDVAIPELAIVAADMLLSGNTYSENEGVYGAQDIGLIPGKEYVRMMTMAAADSDDLFDIDGGSILITNLMFYTTTDCDGTNTWTILIDADDGQDVEFTDAVDVAAVNDGDRIVFSDANPAVLTILAQTANVGSSSLMTGWYCEEGMLEVNNDDSAQAGAFNVYMTFIPLEPGITVTPQ